MTLEQQIEQLQQQILVLQPLTDAQIQQRIESGANGAELVEQEHKNALALRVATIELNSLQSKQAKSQQDAAKKDMAKHQEQRQSHIAGASVALGRALKSIDALEQALAEFDAWSDKAASVAHDINSAAKRAGLPDQIQNHELSSDEFHKMMQRCHAALEKRRFTVYKTIIQPTQE